MAERLEQFIGADHGPASKASATPTRIVFLSDTLPPLGQYLRERSPFLRDCDVIDVRAQEAATELTGTPPDLVVLQVAPGRTPCDALVDHAMHHWPQTALLAFSVDADQDLTFLTERAGVLTALTAPNLKELHEAIEQEIKELSFGTIRGVSLPNLLQILQWEKRTLAVKVQDADNWGRLHLLRGEVVDAFEHAGQSGGEDAALRLLGLPHPRLSLERSYHNQRRVIRASLNNLLMEAMKRLDETPSTSTPDTPLLEDAMFFKRWLRPYADQTADAASPEPPAPVEDDPSPPPHSPEDTTMSNVKELLDSAMGIDGALAAALVDYSSGMALGTAGGGMNLELAAAGNTEVVRAKLRTMDSLGIKGQIEDILITLESQYHIIYVMPQLSMFLYLVLSKDRANLAMARFKLKSLAATISV